MSEATSKPINHPEKCGVTLRNVKESDFPTLFEQQMDPASVHMAAVAARNRDEFTAHWARILADKTITIRTIDFEGHVAGHVVSFERFNQLEVGYWIGKEYWGKGIATKALSQFISQVRARPIYAYVVKDNLASLRVLEKCGFAISSKVRTFSKARGEDVDDIILKLE